LRFPILLKSILNLLADGKFHSDKEIGKFLGVPYKMVPLVLKQILDDLDNATPTLRVHVGPGT